MAPEWQNSRARWSVIDAQHGPLELVSFTYGAPHVRWVDPASPAGAPTADLLYADGTRTTLALPNINPAGTYPEVGLNRTVAPVPATGNHGITLTLPETILSLPEGGAAQTPNVVRVKQDSVGGRVLRFPSTIAWDTGNEPTVNPAPNSVTFLRFIWLGAGRGHLGVTAGYRGHTILIPPYTAQWPVTVNGQAWNLGGLWMRGTLVPSLTNVIDTLTGFGHSAYHRQRLAANGVEVQLAERFATDTIKGADLRATSVGSITYEGANFYAAPVVCLGNVGASGGDPINTIIHEYAHAEDDRYFGGANPSYDDGGTTRTKIRDHSGLVEVFNALIAGGTSLYQSDGIVEWYADWRRGMRTGDNAYLLAHVSAAAGQADVNKANAIINGLVTL